MKNLSAVVEDRNTLINFHIAKSIPQEKDGAPHANETMIGQ
jgi:hypothetical protein